jgi:hypothetical protein
MDLSIEYLGFTEAEREGLLADLVDTETDPADHFEIAATPPVRRRGDLWVLGRHRFMAHLLIS